MSSFAGSSIPEMMGFAPVPFDRESRQRPENPYSVQSYQAMYALTKEEAADAIKTFRSHAAIDMHLSQRYIKDTEYRQRIEEAREDLGATEPSEEVRRVMRRLVESMNPPTAEARKAVEAIIGVLPEDKDGAA